MIGVFGVYVYRAEFTFMALVMINLALLAFVYIKDYRNLSGLRRLIGDKWAMTALSVCVVFVTLCLATPMGNLFGIVRNPIFYFLLSFIPPIAFILCFIFIVPGKNGKK